MNFVTAPSLVFKAYKLISNVYAGFSKLLTIINSLFLTVVLHPHIVLLLSVCLLLFFRAKHCSWLGDVYRCHMSAKFGCVMIGEDCDKLPTLYRLPNTALSSSCNTIKLSCITDVYHIKYAKRKFMTGMVNKTKRQK